MSAAIDRRSRLVLLALSLSVAFASPVDADAPSNGSERGTASPDGPVPSGDVEPTPASSAPVERGPGARDDERSPSPSAAVHASFDDGVRIASADGRFGIRLGALVQVRMQLRQTAQDRWRGRFDTHDVRPQLRMHAFGEQLRVFIQPELAGTSARLLDLELTYQPHPAFAVRVGQFLTPYSRTFFTPVPLLQLFDFGAASDAFRVNRDTGAMVFGTPFDGKLEYYVGAFDGNGIDRDPAEDVHGMGIARFVVAPLGAVPYDQTTFLRGPQPFRFALGVNGFVKRVSPDQSNRSIGADLAVNVASMSMIAELYVRDERTEAAQGLPPDHARSMGAYAQAGWFVPAARLELAARFAWVEPDRALGGDSLFTYEVALNEYVHGNHAKLQLRYLFANAGSAQLGYHHGRQHRLLLYGQLAF